MQTYNEYIEQRIKDLETVKNYLPEMSALLDISIYATQESSKMGTFAAQVKKQLELILKRELSWVESDLFTQLFMAHAGQSLTELVDELDYEELSSSDTIVLFTKVLTDKFCEMFGITDSAGISEVSEDIIKKLFAQF